MEKIQALPEGILYRYREFYIHGWGLTMATQEGRTLLCIMGLKDASSLKAAVNLFYAPHPEAGSVDIEEWNEFKEVLWKFVVHQQQETATVTSLENDIQGEVDENSDAIGQLYLYILGKISKFYQRFVEAHYRRKSGAERFLPHEAKLHGAVQLVNQFIEIAEDQIGVEDAGVVKEVLELLKSLRSAFQNELDSTKRTNRLLKIK